MIESKTNVLWIIKWDPDLGPKTKKTSTKNAQRFVSDLKICISNITHPDQNAHGNHFALHPLLLRSLFHTNATSRGAGLISSVYTRNFLIGLKADFHVYFSAEYLWKILQLEKRQPWQLLFTQNTILEYNHKEFLRFLVLLDLWMYFAIQKK